MSKDRSKLAHDRLTALAMARRRAAERLPPLSAEGRQRLQEEVTRRREGELELPEMRPLARPWRLGWRMFLPWLAVGGAAALLVFMIWLPGASREAVTAERAASSAVEVRAVEHPAVPSAPSLALASAEREVMIVPEATSVSTAKIPALAVPAAAGRAAGSVDLAAAQRLRQQYRALSSNAAAPGLLRSFEVVRRGSRVEFRDEGGTVYTGRVATVSTRTGASIWSYEARGFDRRLGQSVWITGNFGRPEESDSAAGDRGVATSGVDGVRLSAREAGTFLDLPFTATVLLNGTNAVELNAVPVDGGAGQ